MEQNNKDNNALTENAAVKVTEEVATKEETAKKQNTEEVKTGEAKNAEASKEVTNADFCYESLKGDGKAKAAEQSIQQEPTVKKKKRVWIWILLITVLLLIGVYCYIANYYKTHFFQNTSINNIDCSDMQVGEAAGQLDEQALAYHIEIWGRNESGEEVILGTVWAEEMGYTYKDTVSGVSAIMETQNEWLWITSLGNNSRNYSLVQGVTYDAELLKEALKSMDAFQKKNMTAPTDAYISEYSEQIGGYEIISEKAGTKFDIDKAISCIEAAITDNSAETSVTVNLVEQGCYEEPQITADDKKLVEKVDKINKWLSTEITYDWNDSKVVVDKDVIKEWVSFEEDKPVLDEEAVAAFVDENAAANDTAGKSAKFLTSLGVELTLTRRSYGWKTDRQGETEALVELIYAGAKEDREPVYSRKGVWKGQQDIGNSYVEADLTHQHLYVYENGSVVLETDFVSGNINKAGCVTPAGIFGLTYKTKNAVLRGADYETPVSYWMPFYGNFGMHDATWRNAFGGDIFITNGSHGCINLPLDAAAQIYTYVSEGSPIICYYY